MEQSASSGAGGDPPQEKAESEWISFPANDNGEEPQSSNWIQVGLCFPANDNGEEPQSSNWIQDYLKEYIRLMSAEDLQAVQPVKTNQIAAAVAAPANEVPTTNLTTRRFRNQPSTATKIDRVPFTKSRKPAQPLVLNEFDKGEKPKSSDPPQKEEEEFQTDWTILGTGPPSSRTWHDTTAVLYLGEGRTNNKKFIASTENNKFTGPTKNNDNFTGSTLSNRSRPRSY